MKVLPIVSQAAVFSGANVLVEITHEDLTETTANTAQVLEAFSVENGTLVKAVGSYLVTAFEDASDSAFNSTSVTAGDGSDSDRFLTSQQTNANGTEVTAKAGVAAGHAYTADDTVDVTVNSMSAKSLADIDTGKLWLFFQVTKLDQLHG